MESRHTRTEHKATQQSINVATKATHASRMTDIGMECPPHKRKGLNTVPDS